MVILGTEYKVVFDDEIVKSGMDGCCKTYTKEIRLNRIGNMLDPDDPQEVKEKRFNEVYRHEVIHAYFAELGLTRYCDDETLVQVLAVHFPKMAELFKQQGVL